MTILLTRDRTAVAERLIDGWFYGGDPLESFEQFLSKSIDLKYQREVGSEADKKAFSERQGGHLEKYVDVVAEFLSTDRKDWPPCQARIAQLEADLFGQG
jgi:hypothetical protein